MARYFAGQGGNVIDDAETVADEQLFNAWNRAQENDAPLLLVSRWLPADWNIALPDLRSRLAAANLLEIGPPDDELIERAVGMKLNSLVMLAANQIPGAAKEALDTVSLMKKDSNKIVAAAATEKWQTIRILNVTEMNAADRSSLAEEVLTPARRALARATAQIGPQIRG